MVCYHWHSGLAVFVPWLHSVHWPMATVSGQSLCVIADKADCRLCQYVVTFPGFHGLTGVLSNTCTHWPGCSALILLTNTHTLTYIHREALCKLTRCSSSWLECFTSLNQIQLFHIINWGISYHETQCSFHKENNFSLNHPLLHMGQIVTFTTETIGLHIKLFIQLLFV